MKKLSAALGAFLAAAVGLAQTSGDCAPRGDAVKPSIQELNAQMARTDSPSEDEIDDTVTLDALLEPGQDDLRFQNGTGVVVSGYVIAVHDGGPTSANCHTVEPEAQDTVIELASDSNVPDPAHRVFAIVTPRWRSIMVRQKQDWSTRSLRARFLQRWVNVAGWLVFDSSAAKRALNTAPGAGVDVVRATAWEIHPVTAIEPDEEFPPEQTASLASLR
jgi:hypothetical protein